MSREDHIARIAEHIADSESAEARCRWSAGSYLIEGLVTRDGTLAVRRAINSAYDDAFARRSRVYAATCDVVYDAARPPEG